MPDFRPTVDFAFADGLMQSTLIRLQSQDIVATSVNDLFGDCRLCPHRIDRDDRPAHVHKLQNLGNCV